MMAHEKTEAQIDRYSRFGAPLEWLAASVIGAGSAAITFVNLVRTKFHQDAEFRQGFSLLNTSKNEALKKLTDEHLGKVMGLFEKEFGNEPTFDAFKQQRDEVNELVKGGHGIDPKSAEKYDEVAHDFFEACQERIDKIRDNKAFKEYRDHFIKEGKKLKVLHDKKVDHYSENMFGIFSQGVKGHTIGSWQRFKSFSDYAQRNIKFKTAAALGVAFGGTMMVFNQLNTRDKLNEIDKQTERGERKIDAIAEKIGVMESEIKTRREHKENLKHAAKGEQPGMHIVGEGRRHDGMQRDEALEASL